MGHRVGHLLVTGGAGYLGSHVVLRLQRSGFRVTVVDDLSSGGGAGERPGDPFVRMDVRDRAAMAALLSRLKPEAVIHLAGRHRLDVSFEEPEVCAEVNLGGTACLLSAMREAGASRLILASGLCVYGCPPSGRVAEGSPRMPSSPLGRVMVAVEQLLEDAGQAFGLKSVILRVAHLAGAEEELAQREGCECWGGVVGRLARAAVRGDRARPFVVPCAGDQGQWNRPQALDLLHVSDAAAAFEAVLARLRAGSHLPVAFNVASGKAISLVELVEMARELSGLPVPAVRGPLGRGEAESLEADSRLLTERTGWSPKRSWAREILASALEWERRGVHKAPVGS
ncbi:MAG: UDP-glucose 4-epimerase [Bradymonadales bacterium]|nr:UDP-glucose 4-epimerase [Bradymonadales bacterium]